MKTAQSGAHDVIGGVADHLPLAPALSHHWTAMRANLPTVSRVTHLTGLLTNPVMQVTRLVVVADGSREDGFNVPSPGVGCLVRIFSTDAGHSCLGMLMS